MNEVTIPYVQITQVNETIKEFPKEKNCTRDELSNRFGQSKISNIIPTLEILKLIDYDKENGVLSLSNLGKNYKIALITGSDDEAGRMLKPIVMNLEFIKLIYNLLERKKMLTNEEIGKHIAYKYSKDWSTKSMRAYGGSIGSILGFCRLGIYSRGTIRISTNTFNNKKIPFYPTTGFNKIFRITKLIYDFKEAELDDLEKSLGKNVGNDLGPCIELELIERLAPKVYTITDKGAELVNIFNKEKISENWKNILFESKYGDYIIELEGKTINMEILGEFLNNKLGGSWKSKMTAITYAKKFNTWLKAAELVEKKGKGEYFVKKGDNNLNIAELISESSDNKSLNNIVKITESTKNLQKVNDGKVNDENLKPFGIKNKNIFQLIVFFASQLNSAEISLDEISQIIYQDKDLSHTKIAFEILKNDIKKNLIEQDKLHILLKAIMQDLNII